MAHPSIPEPPGFGDLSPLEQLEDLQGLWDRVIDAGTEIPVPESHLRLAEERLAAYRRDPQQARSAYEVLDRLQPRAE